MKAQRPMSGKIRLEEEARDALTAMLEELKSEESSCVRVTPSELVSWILKAFYGRYFVKERDALIKDYTNRKAYLTGILRNVREDRNVEDVLKEALKKMASGKRKKNTQNDSRSCGRFL